MGDLAEDDGAGGSGGGGEVAGEMVEGEPGEEGEGGGFLGLGGDAEVVRWGGR